MAALHAGASAAPVSEPLADLYAALLAWNAGESVRGATAVAVRQTHTAELLGEGFSQREAAGRLGENDDERPPPTARQQARERKLSGPIRPPDER